ncbi:hypothetical protein [Frondihabitans peucedani]|uniref:Uncharacterized protein n=1 Tax=Frondihabitans peucedani TaxID=598626 RepID=A0ABP8E5T4_9MICO
MTEAELPRATNRHLWWRTSWAVGIGAVVGGVLTILLIHRHPPTVLSVVAGVLTVGGYAGFFAMYPSNVIRADELRVPLAGRDRTTRRAIRRAVFAPQGKTDPALTADDHRRAVEYADAFWLNQPVLLVHSQLLLVGVIGTQLLPSFGADSWDVWFRVISFTILPALIVAASIVGILRIRRAAAFSRTQRAATTL